MSSRSLATLLLTPMNRRVLTLAILLLSAALTAQRDQAITEAQVASAQRKVVQAPDDRSLYTHFLSMELQVYEGIGRAPLRQNLRRPEILKLKIVMEDMYSLQDTIQELQIPAGTQEKELIRRLRAAKVPPAHRRLVPLVDPWGTPYRFVIYKGAGWGFTYKIICAGTDKKFDPENMTLTYEEILKQGSEIRSPRLSDDIVFLEGHNFTHIFDYTSDMQAFFYTRCEPADELQPDRVRCF